MKAKHFGELKIAKQILAEASNIVTHQDYVELVYSWFRGNTIKIMHVKRYVFVIIFFFKGPFDIFSYICPYR